MRKVISLLILTVLISCKKEVKEKGSEIIGEWGIYVSYLEDVTIACNACPKILFENSNIAVLTLPSGETERYKWDSSGKLLNLKHLDYKNVDVYFDDAEYNIEFKEKEGFTELTLFLGEKKEFLLRK